MNKKVSANNYSEKYNELTSTLIKKLFDMQERKNIVFSPFSIIMLLGIVTGAVDGAARDELLMILGKKYTYTEIQEILCEMQKIFTSNGELISSNAVCVRADIMKSINPDFEKSLVEYGGKLFPSNNIVEEVNAWVNEKTKGMITDIADESMKDMFACIMNAIAFEADWMEQYDEDEIYEDDFTNADGSISPIQMMDSTEYTYIENSFFTGFVKLYKDGDYLFVGLLPKKKVPTFIKRAINDLDFSEIMKKTSHTKVYVSMPEFKIDFEKTLNETLMEMGATTVFSPNADFSPMTTEWAKIDSVIHKAHIEVDRKGTKAAAVTAGIVVCGAAPMMEDYKKVCLNRPFVYAIVHRETKLPIFVGMMNKV